MVVVILQVNLVLMSKNNYADVGRFTSYQQQTSKSLIPLRYQFFAFGI
jgi:hypothetical protein